jgi:hypothetical protein
MIIHATPLGLGSDLDRFHPCSSVATAVLSLYLSFRQGSGPLLISFLFCQPLLRLCLFA